MPTPCPYIVMQWTERQSVYCGDRYGVGMSHCGDRYGVGMSLFGVRGQHVSKIRRLALKSK